MTEIKKSKSHHNKEFYQEHREKIIDKAKVYYLANKEKILAYKKEHYKQLNNDLTTCECGKQIKTICYKSHLKSKKHIVSLTT